MSYLSISTWSLHRELGPLHWNFWDDEKKQIQVQTENQPETIKLVDLPTILNSKGFGAAEICHFHFQSTERDYLEQLKSAFEKADIEFHTLLIDYGDIATSDETRRHADIDFIKKWIEIASIAGAKRVRVIAGDAGSEDHEALERSSKSLNKLAEFAHTYGVRVITENFRALTSKAENCIYLAEHSNGKIGLITDFGNFSGDTKYEDLEKILPYSDSVHAKADFDDHGTPDEEEFKKCLDLLPIVNYDGPITLIYDGPGDMWAGIDRVRKIVDSYL